MAEWISVKDNRPSVKDVKDRYADYKESEPVLAFCKDGKYAIVQYEVDNDGFSIWTRDDGGGEEITHWMPLPAPPLRKD